LWNTITRNDAWWLTVHNERYAWPVLRESLQSEPEADARVFELKGEIESGDPPSDLPALRRRRRRPLESRMKDTGRTPPEA